MIDFPVIDTHVHIWNLNLLEYPWLEGVPAINRTFLLSDYDQARGDYDVEAMVFIQCECKSAQHLAELAWVQTVADANPRLKAIVPWAPLETGEAVARELTQMALDPRIKGVRRIIQFEDDPDFCLRPGFICGVQLLGKNDLHCELTIAPRHFPNVLRLVEACPGTSFILDHIGNPEIAAGQIQPWKNFLKDFAAAGPHFCKFSNLVCNADLSNWIVDDLKPFADAVIETFGPDRLIWGSDWPHALRASSWQRWIEAADELTSYLSESERRKIFHDSAVNFYRIKPANTQN